ncbi:unnamed protein product, partial [Prorocentrum cordatum]
MSRPAKYSRRDVAGSALAFGRAEPSLPDSLSWEARFWATGRAAAWPPACEVTPPGAAVRRDAAAAPGVTPVGNAAIPDAVVVPGSSSSLPLPAQMPSRRRADEPLISCIRRGSKPAALAAISTEEGRARALQSLMSDQHAASSWATRDSYLRTWLEFHTAWFAESVPAFPLSVDILYAVGAAFKAGHYRSAKDYFARAKGRHIELGYVWHDTLQQASARAIRSVTRGMGPGRQSAALPLPELAALGERGIITVSGGPLGGADLAIAASFFCLREIELSLACWGHVTLDDVAAKVTWVLPASKTDPSALGGHVVAKEKIVDLIEALAELLNLPLVDHSGGRRFGGRTFRVSGAQHLASIGIPLMVIQLLARWSSQVIMRYVSEAPFAVVGAECRRRNATLSLEAIATRSEGDARAFKDRLARVETGGLILSSYGVVHRPLSRYWYKLQPGLWSARCGWKYGASMKGFSTVSKCSGSPRCEKCFEG